MSNKTEDHRQRQQQHDLQHEIATKRPTVEELLKMLSTNSTPSSSNRPSPPPVPPKPKPGFEMTIEAAKRSLGLLPDPKKQAATGGASDASNSKGNKSSANRTFLVNNGAGDETPDPIEKHDTGIAADSSSPITSRLGYYENNYPPSSTLVTKITASTSRVNPGGSIVYISSPASSSSPRSSGENISHQNGHKRNHSSTVAAAAVTTSSSTSKPIVTELPDETNNNNILKRQQQQQLRQHHSNNSSNNTSNKSTVEILELPGGAGGHGYADASLGNKQQPATTASPRAHHRNHAGSGASASTLAAASNLVVVSTTAAADHIANYADVDDDDLARGADDESQLAKEVETILSDSLRATNHQPPRTSTPTPTAELIRRHQTQTNSSTTNPSTGASSAANNNNNRSSHQDAYRTPTHSFHTGGNNQQRRPPPTTTSDFNNSSENDTLNISRETDELTNNDNTSVLNQSGCELVGVNDNSDPSPRKPAQAAILGAAGGNTTTSSQHDLTTPYTVQFFNDTLLSPSGSSASPPDRLGSGSQTSNQNSQQSSTEALNTKRSSRSHHEMSIQELESSANLRKLVGTLQEQIERLNSKVSGLTSKVEDLESELDRQKRGVNGALLSTAGSKSTASIFEASQGANADPQSNLQSPLQKLSPLSQSISSINKFTPMKSSTRHTTNNGSSLYAPAMSTYTRGPSQQASPSGGGGGNNNLLTTATTMTPRRSHNQSYGGGHSSGMSRQAQIRSNRSNLNNINSIHNNNSHHHHSHNVHTSTNSLYAESNKSAGSASISPTPQVVDGSGSNNARASRDYASPSSYLTQSRRAGDLAASSSAYTSMLSLSSVGGGSNSTLRPPGSMAGSVSNLSQFGTLSTSQLSNWPSMSNFITSKHQAKDILYDDEEQVIRMVLYNTLITMRVPSWLGPEYNLDRIIEAPSNLRLKLDWVHGYRGRDCRSNIYYLPTGECIYFVASVVVLYNAEERTQRHYLGHTDSVKCLAVHPNRLIVASGQSAIANRRDKRPIVRVWNTVSLATIRVIGFNEDFDRSICCLAFSKHDAGATLAVVDESSEHTITLLDWQREKNWRVAEANSGHEPVLAIDFHPVDKYSLVAVGKSSINFWDIRGMTLAKKAGLFDKYDRPKYVLCMTFNDLGETITGDSNGNIIIWPRGTNKPRRIIRDAHPGGVFSVLAMKDSSYLTGGRDRRIVEWDEAFEPTGRQAELPEHCGGVRFITCARGAQVLIGTLRNSILLGSLDSGFQIIVQGHTEATAALAVHPTLPKYLTGGFDDQVHFLDVETHALEWTKCLAMPITAASFSPNGAILILGSTSGNWLALDATTQEILFTACDGTGTFNCVKFSPSGEMFAMGSSDCQIYIYETTPSGNTFARLGTCVGHSAPVKEIDWSLDDNAYIQSQSMNFELLFWKAHNCRPVDTDDIVHDLKWTTHNCTIGFNVIGIWSDSIDSALINHCDKSNNDKYIVSATDTGFLNIYKWPTYYNQCSSQKYYGNVDKFNFIKFLSDDSKLIAVSAKGCATTEWSIIEEED